MRTLLIIVSIVSIPYFAIAQNHSSGFHNFQPTECLSPEARAKIETELTQNVQTLKNKDLLIEKSNSIVLFDWPVRHKDGYQDPGYYGIYNYVDQDYRISGSIRDYTCGNRTYDGHRGIDIFSWPFWWEKMDNDAIEVIAAAPGTIIGRIDGFYDRNCSCINFNWNAVYIQHADGSQAWYGHLKNDWTNGRTRRVFRCSG